MKGKALENKKEYYHIYCRGNNKQPIFLNKKDYERLLVTVLLFQSPSPLPHFSRIASNFYKRKLEALDQEIIDNIIIQRGVELIGFSFMPNHFHLVLGEIKEGGIPHYMSRILNSYTKFINTKYERSGHLFQGRFGRKHIVSNNQLLYLLTYVHRNPRELPQWKNKEDKYPWSSYQDYIYENRWSGLLASDIIMDQFKSKEEYYKFTKTSIAKAEEVLDSDLFSL